MKDPVFFFGTGGALATFGLGGLNHAVGVAVGLVTMAALLPVAIQRWRDFFKK